MEMRKNSLSAKCEKKFLRIGGLKLTNLIAIKSQRVRNGFNSRIVLPGPITCFHKFIPEFQSAKLLEKNYPT